MRVRLFVEAELDDEKIKLVWLGSGVGSEHREHEFQSGLARQVESFIGGLNSVKEVKAVYIPKLLST